MNKQKFIEEISLYRPHFSWTHHYGEDMSDEALLDEKYSAFKEIVGNQTPNEYNERQFYGWRTYWKYEKNHKEWEEDLERWSGMVGLHDNNLPDFVRFQVGTSLERAKAFIREGQGYVTTENIMGTPDWNPYDRWLGLQVSIPNKERGSYDRLYYYSEVQAGQVGDKQAILTGLIPREYLWSQRNGGEYCISRIHYNKIIAPEILFPEDYRKKYLA